MIEYYASPAFVNNNQDPWLIGEGVATSGSIAIPSLNFDFVNYSFPAEITFTRASSATYFDSTGTLTTAANNVPRLDYNPATLAARGLLIEEQRVNSIRNNTMQGAVAGTPGTLPTNWVQTALAAGLTASVLGTGTSSGITYIDIRISGTTADTTGWSVFTDASTQIAASSGQIWAGSSYVAIIGGSTANITAGFIRVAERNSGGGYITESNIPWTAATAVLANNRFSVTRTLGATAAFVQYGVYFQANSGVAIDITLRIGLPQLELGAFATSVIPTTGAAATRSADVASVTTLTPWFNATEGTVYAEFASYGLATVFPTVWQLDDGTTQNALTGYVFTNILGTAQRTLNVSQGDLNTVGVAINWNNNTKMGYAYATNNSALSGNGSALTGLAVDSTVSIPSVNNLKLGSKVSGAQSINGWLRRITYYPRRLSNAELQAITA